MLIVVDGFGGDHAPLSTVEGAINAAKKYSVNVCLTGPVDQLEKLLKEKGAPSSVTVRDAELCKELGIDDLTAVRTKAPSSMVTAFNMVKADEADAFVSCGSTAAIVLGGAALVGRAKGIRRLALGTPIPKENGSILLLDSGAGLDCNAETLLEFARSGAAFMASITGRPDVKVGLINNGTEEYKGRAEYIEAHKLLSESDLNFCGNLEPRDLFTTDFDVAVCDGFTGNAILKAAEGAASFFSSGLKAAFKKSPITMLGALMAKSGIEDFRRKFDYSEYGGVPVIGVSKPVIKGHGSSNSRAVENAIRQAMLAAQGVKDIGMKE